MPKSLQELVSIDRRRLANQYAHIDYLEDFAHQCQPIATSDAARKVSASRRLLQDPYAYLDERGEFSAAGLDTHALAAAHSTHGAAKSSLSRKAVLGVRHSDREIERQVRRLHKRLWRERADLWPNGVPKDPIDILDPAIALSLIGYDYELVDGLGQYRTSSGLIEVAGVIDQPSRTVKISGQFRLSERHFTLAHELGHAVLHPSNIGTHRDRAKEGPAFSRDPVEIQADKFATFFLLPARLVSSRFAQIFGSGSFELNDDTAFALSGSSFHNFKSKHPQKHDLCLLLASTGRFNGQNLVPLAEQFRVSAKAMAIRLEEIGLVA